MAIRPTVRLIGERGPEAVIPLHRLGAMGGGPVQIGDINIQAGGPLDLVAIARLASQAVMQKILESGRARGVIRHASRGL